MTYYRHLKTWGGGLNTVLSIFWWNSITNSVQNIYSRETNVTRVTMKSFLKDPENNFLPKNRRINYSKYSGNTTIVGSQMLSSSYIYTREKRTPGGLWCSNFWSSVVAPYLLNAAPDPRTILWTIKENLRSPGCKQKRILIHCQNLS